MLRYLLTYGIISLLIYIGMNYEKWWWRYKFPKLPNPEKVGVALQECIDDTQIGQRAPTPLEELLKADFVKKADAQRPLKKDGEEQPIK